MPEVVLGNLGRGPGNFGITTTRGVKGLETDHKFIIGNKYLFSFSNLANWPV